MKPKPMQVIGFPNWEVQKDYIMEAFQDLRPKEHPGLSDNIEGTFGTLGHIAIGGEIRPNWADENEVPLSLDKIMRYEDLVSSVSRGLVGPVSFLEKLLNPETEENIGNWIRNLKAEAIMGMGMPTATKGASERGLSSYVYEIRGNAYFNGNIPGATPPYGGTQLLVSGRFPLNNVRKLTVNRLNETYEIGGLNNV